jgi:hypothetical protein
MSGAALALCALAPDAALAGPEWGVKGGLSVAGVRWDNAVFEPQSKLGFAGGASARFAFAKRAYVQPEVLYVMKGFSFGESEQTDTAGNSVGMIETLLAADYVQVPVLVGYELPPRGTFQTALYAGPMIGFETRERFVTTGDIDVSTNDDLLVNTDYGISLGARLGKSSGPGLWELDVRFDRGLAQLARTGNDIGSWAVLVMAGFTFAHAR